MSRSLTLALALLVTFTTAASAQWTLVDSLKLGGYSGVTNLAIDSSGHILGPGNGATLLSYDLSAHSWSSAPLPGTSGTGSIYVVTPSGWLVTDAGRTQTLSYSKDRGATWNMLGRGLTINGSGSLVWNDTLLLASNTTGSGLMVLHGGDSNWQQVNVTFPIRPTSAYVTKSGYFVVGSGRHLYRSKDPLHWDLNDTAAVDAKITKTLVTSEGTILAIGQFSNSIYRSTDWGTTWSTPLNLPGLTSLQTMIALKHGWVAVIARGGFYLSTNDGSTWSQVKHLPLVNTYAITQTPSDDLVASSVIGVYLSRDRGASWNALDSGITRITPNGIGSNVDTLFVSEPIRGVYRFLKSPSRWVESDDSLSSTLTQFQYAHGTLYAQSDQNLVYWNGASWSALPNLFEDRAPITYAMSKTGRMFSATSAQFFYLSTDNDWRTVTPLFGLLVKQCAVDSAGNVYALVGKDSVFYSTDDGASWSELANHPWTSSVAAIVATKDTLVVATSGGTTNGLYMTGDLGAHWKSWPYTLTNIRGANVYQGRYLVFSGSALIEREAQETSWTPSQDIPSLTTISAMTIAPSGWAYLATSSGLYVRQLPGVFNLVTGADEPNSFAIFPNPARSSVTVSGAASVDVMDVTGRSFGRFVDGTIDCSRFPAGVYQVRASDGRVARLVIVR